MMERWNSQLTTHNSGLGSAWHPKNGNKRYLFRYYDIEASSAEGICGCFKVFLGSSGAQLDHLSSFFRQRERAANLWRATIGRILQLKLNIVIQASTVSKRARGHITFDKLYCCVAPLH
jgi:hypothetical protein